MGRTLTEEREIRKLLDDAILRLEATVRVYGVSSNPQVISRKDLAQGRLDMAKAIAEALGGNLVSLRTYAGWD